MKKTFVKAVALVAVLGMASFASLAVAGSQSKATTSTAVHHGHEMRGAITTYDEAGKTLTLRDTAGKEMAFSLTAATAIHGSLSVGENATVRYMVKQGKDIATSIRVAAAAPAAAPVKK